MSQARAFPFKEFICDSYLVWLLALTQLTHKICGDRTWGEVEEEEEWREMLTATLWRYVTGANIIILRIKAIHGVYTWSISLFRRYIPSLSNFAYTEDCSPEVVVGGYVTTELLES